tara:strand:- start:1586 stop:1699 length:114 start_codon:yes stop_codon:yes gene_type:complete
MNETVYDAMYIIDVISDSGFKIVLLMIIFKYVKEKLR